MPYILNKTNGAVLTTVEDATVNLTTGLAFPGRNYSGYGELVNENFVKLLENFSNTTPPARPLIGQLWFDTSSTEKRLKLCFDGTNFKPIANISIQTSPPSYKNKGDLWWDSNNNQLNVFNGSSFTLIGPQESAAAAAYWKYADETGTENINVSNFILKAYVGETPIVTVSKDAFTPVTNSDLIGSGNFTTVKKGITLSGAHPVTGSSTSTGFYFWGTAAESLQATTATSIAVTNDQTTNKSFYLTFVSTSSGNNRVFASGTLSYNPSLDLLNTRSTAAVYADLAERYEADAVYEAGTVVVVGGDKEITTTNRHGSTSIAGVISKNPAYMMNSAAGSDKTHPYVALKGRVMCKVTGPIRKGDRLVSSAFPGYACSYEATHCTEPNAVFARALQDHSDEFGMIEVKI